MDTLVDEITTEIAEFFSQPTAYRSVLILIAAIIASYVASRFLALGIIRLAQKVSLRTDAVSDDVKAIRMRQIETYLSITVAVVRAAVVAVVAYIAWRMVSPQASSGAAAIGASAFFIVFAGQTLGMILRDITAGVTMITEQWFHVGDFVKIEPFIDVEGVVERFTLRSTKLRNINGEVIWIHNQQIQAAHVTHNSIRTLAVDLFTHDKERAIEAINSITSAIPTGTLMLEKKLRIKSTEQWGDNLWRITVIGKTVPGREWLIEQFFVNAIKAVDERKRKSDRIFTFEPIARYADPVAERKFKRAIRAGRDES